MPAKQRPLTYKILLGGWNDYSLPFWVEDGLPSFYCVKLTPCINLKKGGLVNRIEQAMERSALAVRMEAHR